MRRKKKKIKERDGTKLGRGKHTKRKSEGKKDG
jgi:hypothetical protein